MVFTFLPKIIIKFANSGEDEKSDSCIDMIRGSTQQESYYDFKNPNLTTVVDASVLVALYMLNTC